MECEINSNIFEGLENQISSEKPEEIKNLEKYTLNTSKELNMQKIKGKANFDRKERGDFFRE